jgi:hypothetical protein
VYSWTKNSARRRIRRKKRTKKKGESIKDRYKERRRWSW